MLRANIPIRFQKAWAEAAAGAYIRTVPVDSQIGIQDGAASFETGFVPDNFAALVSGGVPPFGQDFNGLNNIMTKWDQWYQAGAPIPYHAPYAAAVGGYPQGAVLDSAVVLGVQWCSLVDSNMTDPDDPLTSANWMRVGVQPGTPIPSFASSALPNCVLANALTIGSVASNASQRANADTIFVYRALWQQFSTTACPIYTSAGVLTTRGANASADFAANKALATPDMKGRGVIGVDNMAGAASTRLSGVPFSIGNSTTPGSFCGENLHVILAAELANHFHAAGIFDPTHLHGANFGVRGFSTSGSAQAYQTPPGVDGTVNNNTNSASTGVRVNSPNGLDTTYSTGSNTAHNTVEQNLTVYWNLPL
jgi:hypothetical protein